MTFTEKQLAQGRLTTTATSLYSPAASTTGIIKNITITNTGTSEQTFTLYVDDSGTTYDEGTTIAWEIPIKVGRCMQIQCFIPMNDSTGNIAAKSDGTNVVTVTLFGAEVT